MPSRKDIDTSDRFVPQAVASEADLPEAITYHWLPILRAEGLLVECPLDQFTATVDWVPLYTRKEISSGGTILLYEPRCTKLDSHCAPPLSSLCGNRLTSLGGAGNLPSVPTVELLTRTLTRFSATVRLWRLLL